MKIQRFMREVVQPYSNNKKNGQGKRLLETQASVLWRTANTLQAGLHSQLVSLHCQRAEGCEDQRKGREKAGPEGRITGLLGHFLIETYGSGIQFISEIIQTLPSDCTDGDDHRDSLYWQSVWYTGLSSGVPEME